ncbi:MAG: type IV toxin-antitoxin system AbiEi family antitoxin domain-containing protein [Thermoleophilaceae bacterium]
MAHRTPQLNRDAAKAAALAVGDVDRAIAELAGHQHGVVARRQLRALGVGVDAIANRVKRGRLHVLHRGTYAVGHAVVSADGRLMAAALAVGEGVVVSHASAADLWGLRPTSRRDVDVTTPRASHPRLGIRVHRSVTLTPEEVTTARGIPCTAVARTLIDLGEAASRRAVEQALDRAEALRVFDLREIEAALERHRRRRGAATLRAVLESHAIGATITRSELEERFLALCRQAGLPAPQLNVPLALADGEVATVDALWRDQRVVVETDGRASHATAAAFERDRWRDAQLQRAGYAVVRLTWRRVVHEAPAVARTLRELLRDRTPIQ